MYQLFDSETIEAWKRFDLTSKLFVAKCYEEEELKNGKSIKELHEIQIDSDSNDAL